VGIRPARGIASTRFDINQEGLQFVSAVLRFLWMNKEQLGFNLTIIAEGGQYIEIEQNNQRERLVIDEVMKCVPCIERQLVGRLIATGTIREPLLLSKTRGGFRNAKRRANCCVRRLPRAWPMSRDTITMRRFL
jgi:hypothetical protein